MACQYFFGWIEEPEPAQAKPERRKGRSRKPRTITIEGITIRPQWNWSRGYTKHVRDHMRLLTKRMNIGRLTKVEYVFDRPEQAAALAAE